MDAEENTCFAKLGEMIDLCTSSPQDCLGVYTSITPYLCALYGERVRIPIALVVHLFRHGTVAQVAELLTLADTQVAPPCTKGSACRSEHSHPRIAETAFSRLRDEGYTCTSEQVDLVWEWLERYPRVVCELTFQTEGWASMCARITDPTFVEVAAGHVFTYMFHMRNGRLATRLASDLSGAMPCEPALGFIGRFHAAIKKLATYVRLMGMFSTPVGNLPLPVVVDEFISKLPSVYKTSRGATGDRTAVEIYRSEVGNFPNQALVQALSVSPSISTTTTCGLG